MFHVERHNLTTGTLINRFTQLSCGFSEKLENLEAVCAIFMAYHYFCWRTRDVIEGRTRLPAVKVPGLVSAI